MLSNELGSDGQCIGLGEFQSTCRISHLQLFPAMVFYLFQVVLCSLLLSD